MTGAPMILVELDSVAVQWVGQETLPGATFKREKVGDITFIPTFM
jgi:hypothetical protein